MNFENIKTIHFVGIGGIGMSGIAEILADRGLVVSGCDLKASAMTDLLIGRGIPVTIGHDPVHLHGADLVVVTSAVKGYNVEIDSALQRGIPVVKRKEILGHIVNRKRAIGVSGTHGKTTTSAMVAVILEEAGLDPTVLIGGMLRNIGANAKSGGGEMLIVEADEYDRTFHELHPEIAVVTNIEADHLEYFGSFEAIKEAFRTFVEGVKPGGAVVGCIDDPTVAKLLDGLSVAAGSQPDARPERPSIHIIRYSLGDAINISFDERGSHFEVPGAGWFRLF